MYIRVVCCLLIESKCTPKRGGKSLPTSPPHVAVSSPPPPSIHSMKKGDRKGRDIQAYEIHAPRHIGKIKGRRNSTQKEKIDLYSTRRFLAVAFKNKKTLLNNAPRFFPTFSEKFSAHLFFIYNATWKNSIHYDRRLSIWYSIPSSWHLYNQEINYIKKIVISLYKTSEDLNVDWLWSIR